MPPLDLHPRVRTTLARLESDDRWAAEEAHAAWALAGRCQPADTPLQHRLQPFVHPLDLMGLADQHVHGADILTRLRPVGRATAIEAIRTRATVPSHPPRSG